MLEEFDGEQYRRSRCYSIMEEPNRKMSCLQTMNQIRIGIAKGRSIVLLTVIADYYGGMRG